MSFSNFEFIPDNFPKDPAEFEAFLQKQQSLFVQELKTNPIYIDFFSQYRASSVETFIEDHAHLKIQLIRYHQLYKKTYEETKEIRYQERTEEMFWLIAQKKLFNMQCLWRAEQINIPEIKIGYHFEYWAKNIQTCPFLESITHHDVELMKSYLRSDDFSDDNRHYLYNLQCYEDILEKDSSDDYLNMPEWYEFYDTYTASAQLLLLPNTRKQKEDHYLSIGYQLEKLSQPQASASAQVHDAPPPDTRMPLFSEDREIFFNRFENHKFKQLKKGYDIFHKKTPVGNTSDWELEKLQNAIELLAEADHSIIMPGGLDWKSAILKCAQQYINNIIADNIDEVYERYLMVRQLNATATYTKEQLTAAYRNFQHTAFLEDTILKARKHLNEPDDFDF